jgi:hypothetical protein
MTFSPTRGDSALSFLLWFCEASGTQEVSQRNSQNDYTDFVQLMTLFAALFKRGSSGGFEHSSSCLNWPGLWRLSRPSDE